MNSQKEIFKDIRFISVIVSLIISVWCSYNSIINSDGVLYLHAASLISEGQWSLATSVYRWSFYPWLISIISQLSNLSLESSAHLLNGGLAALTVYSFLNLLKELSNDKKILIAGAIIILIYPTLNGYRSSFFRDSGYLPFYLLSAWLFLRYLRTNNWSSAISWSASMMVATLFRVEGSVFLFLIPIIILVNTSIPVRQRFKLLLKANIVLLVILFFVLLFWLLGSDLLLRDFNRLQEPITYMQGLLGNVTTGMEDKASILKEHFLNRYAHDYALIIVWLSFLVILIMSIIKTLTPVFSILAVHSMYRGLAFSSHYLKLFWFWLVFLNLVILGVFLADRHFIDERYPLAISITVMLVVPFTLVTVYESWRKRGSRSWKRKSVFPLIVVLLFSMAIHGLISFGPSRDYIKNAGLWVKKNTPDEATLYSNEISLLYYVGKLKTAEIRSINSSWKGTLSILEDKHRKYYDYLAIRVSRNDPEQEASIIKILMAEPIKIFINNRGDKVLIFSEKK